MCCLPRSRQFCLLVTAPGWTGVFSEPLLEVKGKDRRQGDLAVGQTWTSLGDLIWLTWTTQRTGGVDFKPKDVEED